MSNQGAACGSLYCVRRGRNTDAGRKGQQNYLPVALFESESKPTWLDMWICVNTRVSRCVLLCGIALVPRCMYVCMFVCLYVRMCVRTTTGHGKRTLRATRPRPKATATSRQPEPHHAAQKIYFGCPIRKLFTHSKRPRLGYWNRGDHGSGFSAALVHENS